MVLYSNGEADMEQNSILSIRTKEKIFNAALRLFSQNGYESVSVRTIADSVGIKVSSIYNHYDNKSRILEACYDFYTKNRYSTRLTKEQYVPILKDGSREELISLLDRYYPDDIRENMILSLHIVYSRIFLDKTAREIYVSDVNDAMEYLNEFFNTGIEIGRFYPFNVEAYSLIILGFRIFTAQSVIIKPMIKGDWRVAEVSAYTEINKLLPFRY